MEHGETPQGPLVLSNVGAAHTRRKMARPCCGVRCRPRRKGGVARVTLRVAVTIDGVSTCLEVVFPLTSFETAVPSPRFPCRKEGNAMAGNRSGLPARTALQFPQAIGRQREGGEGAEVERMV